MNALLVALLSISPLVATTTGPYVGVLDEGETATHRYDNTPPEAPPCPDYFAPIWWIVRLDYAPPTSTLTLEVVGRGAATGANGQATVVFEGGGCEELDLVVTAVDAVSPTAYALQVGTSTVAPA